jgi:hypothetical protein
MINTLACLAKDEFEIKVGLSHGLRSATSLVEEQLSQLMNGNW